MPALVDGTVRGNYGLMDQVAALHWIQENIVEFGGQPNNVTIIGHGYGAACAHLLMISPMARGLQMHSFLINYSKKTLYLRDQRIFIIISNNYFISSLRFQ